MSVDDCIEGKMELRYFVGQSHGVVICAVALGFLSSVGYNKIG